MNVVGRQMSRSNSTTTMTQQQRQYSDNFIDGARWLQSSSLLSQDFGYGSRMNRSMQSTDPSTPPLCSRSSSLRKSRDDYLSPSDLSPGLLDLHSFDTELLTEVSVPTSYEGYQTSRGESFDDSEPYLAADKLTNRSRVLPECNLLKSLSMDKERANNVAKIKVVVRKRPLNKKEMSRKEDDIITIEQNLNCLTVHETKLKVDLTEYVEKHEFIFDAVLDADISNGEVYSETVEPMVPLIFHRTKGTCFAYGQTGSGKTYTMQPLPLKASQDILRLMLHTYRNQGFQLFVSFFEIYGGKLFDLLNDRKKLCMREDGKQQVCIVGLREYKVSDVEAIKEFIEKGNATRSTGVTGANEESSRSHAILQLALKRSADGSESKPARTVGKLSFIDLAGSERGADTTDNDKQTRIEGAEINKSLLALKECIRALDNDQGHIPFRGRSCEHTLNTLRYADRVKSLSKGNSSKRDPLLSSNVQDSIALSSTSVLPTEATFEDNTTVIPNENIRFVGSKPIEKDSSLPSNVNQNLSGVANGKLAAPVISEDYYKGQRDGRNETTEDDFDYLEETYEQETQPYMHNRKVVISALEDRHRRDDQPKRREVLNFLVNNCHSDDDLNALLKEEEDLVSAHRKQVEETIDIIREEMNLLVEADQPGNKLDDYVSKLNAILSQKAAGILQLQTRLVQFQRHLKELNVLVSLSSN
uniref:Kinesin-like protein n=1 Tax=Rhizophora mucronata TaxID=61149 RepID=A0A2P2JHT7_RHIMU